MVIILHQKTNVLSSYSDSLPEVEPQAVTLGEHASANVALYKGRHWGQYLSVGFPSVLPHWRHTWLAAAGMQTGLISPSAALYLRSHLPNGARSIPYLMGESSSNLPSTLPSIFNNASGFIFPKPLTNLGGWWGTRSWDDAWVMATNVYL